MQRNVCNVCFGQNKIQEHFVLVHSNGSDSHLASFQYVTRVILLIYEYAIAVEWSLVQKIRGGNVTNITHDTPFAEKLDRRFFGFDQDYYERMPLLVNALQESNYVDPVVEMSKPLSKPYGKNSTIPKIFTSDTMRQSKIRKSSPRPFIFEYRSPTPVPFSKTYGSRSWVDSYRNAQRLQNIRQVIRYLEKTINAKAGDMHVKPTNSHTSIAFSGVYVEPKIEKDVSGETNSMEQIPQNSNRVETYANHNEDPLFNFKPDSPGDVNLLADTFFRFSPQPTQNIVEDRESNKIAMFRRIPYRKICRGSSCNDSFENKPNSLKTTSTEHYTELPTSSTKSFSVMLNLFPIKPNKSPEFNRNDEKTTPPLEKIYITTSKPLIQFRKKTLPSRRTYYRYKRPRYLIRNTSESRNIDRFEHGAKVVNNSTAMLVHVDVYSPDDKNGFRNHTKIHYTTSSIRPSMPLPVIGNPVELSASQVEDFHDGSSGLITVQIPVEPEPTTLPPAVTTIPNFDYNTHPLLLVTSSSETNPWATNPPDILKFSAEDAKVPEQYINMATTQTVPMINSMNYMNWETTLNPIKISRMDIMTNMYTKQMDRKYVDWETTLTPLETEGMKDIMSLNTAQIDDDYIESTQSTKETIRSMNLVTTQEAPMEIVQVNMDWLTTQAPFDIDESGTNTNTIQTTTMAERGNMKWITTIAPTELERYGKALKRPSKDFRDRLLLKLRNKATTTESAETTTTEEYYDEEIEETTTSKTYVPQTNGHYRNIATTRNYTKYNPDTNGKRKLEISMTGFRSHVPMYTEIRRNRTKTVSSSLSN